MNAWVTVLAAAGPTAFEHVLTLAGEGIAVCSPIIAILAAGARWLLRRFTKIEERVEEVSKAVGETKTDVGAIKGQLSNNGGKSLKDAVDRMDERTGETTRAVADLRTDVAVLASRFNDYLALPPAPPGTGGTQHPRRRTT